MWWCGGLVVWCGGVMVVWWCGGVVVWWCGGGGGGGVEVMVVVVWWCGGVVVLCGGVVWWWWRGGGGGGASDGAIAAMSLAIPLHAQLIRVAGHLGFRLPATPPLLPRPNGGGQTLALCLCTGPQQHLQESLPTAAPWPSARTP